MTGKLPLACGRLAWCVMSVAAVTGLSGPVLAERPTAAKLLPETTSAVLWIPNAPEMSRRFLNTAFGQMLQDPQLEPLVKHLYGSLAEAVGSAQDRIGLSLAELLAIPQGELAIAVVAPEEGPPEVVVLLDVGDQLSNARKLLQRGTDALEQSGAAKSEETVAGTKLVVYDGVGPQRRKLVLCEKDATVVAGSSVEVLGKMLSVWNGEGEEDHTLAHNEKFAAIMRRSGSKDQRPHVVWYADPIAIMRSVGQRNPGARIAVAMLPTLGLDGVNALGGSFTLDAGQFDSVVYAHVLLDSPRTGILELIALEPGDAEPEPWVPADVANYTTLHWNFETTFTGLVELYDSFLGDGAFANLLDKRIKEPIGLDMAKDLLPALAGRVTHFSWIERPITLRSQATLVGFQLTDPRALAEVVEKVFQQNAAFLARQSFGGKEYFQWTPPRLSDEPSDAPRPIPCFGVLGDYLIVTDRPSLYQKVVVTAAGSAESLADALDFKLIASKIDAQSGDTGPAMIGFERPEEGMRLLYELGVSDNAREQLRRQAEANPFLKSLNTALDENPLPPFAVIERYLAPSGAMVVDDETGLHYTGFSLRRKPD